MIITGSTMTKLLIASVVTSLASLFVSARALTADAPLPLQVQSTALQWFAMIIPTIGALAAAIISIITAIRTGAVAATTNKLVDSNAIIAAKTEVIAAKTDHVVETTGRLVDSSAVIADKTIAMEQQGNSRAAEHATRLADVTSKLEAAIREAAELKTLVSQLVPGARVAALKSADAKGLADRHVADEKSGSVGTGLSGQAKKDVKEQADRAIKDAGLSGSAGPDSPRQGKL